MPLPVKKILATLSKDLIRAAEKITVRECDEIEKGQFVAYLDEGTDTYDVSVTISKENEVISQSCDCNNGKGECVHKVALLLYLNNGKKPKQTTVKQKKKESQAEVLLRDAETEKLKAWVFEVITKNKDLELAFVHFFSEEAIQYTPGDVIKMINNAIKAVGVTKKGIDATQLKKLIELWTNMLTPVVESYCANVTEGNSFLNIHALFIHCTQFNNIAKTSSNKIIKFLEQVLHDIELPIHNLKIDDAWHKTLEHFMTHVQDGNKINIMYLHLINNVISTADEKRRNKVIARLMADFNINRTDQFFNGNHYAKFMLDLTERNNVFMQYHSKFQPLRFENDFNRQLIELLIDNKLLDLAASYCERQIQTNYREEYNIAYLQLLKTIYTMQNNEKKLLNVLSLLLPHTFSFDDFLTVTEKMPEEERKKYRTKILTRSGHMNVNPAASAFRLRLLAYEHDFKKMASYLDNKTPLDVVATYFEPMFFADKQELLKKLLNREDGYGQTYQKKETEEERIFFPVLYSLMEKNYGAEYLTLTIKQMENTKYFYNPGRLYNYIRTRLWE